MRVEMISIAFYAGLDVQREVLVNVDAEVEDGAHVEEVV